MSVGDDVSSRCSSSAVPGGKWVELTEQVQQARKYSTHSDMQQLEETVHGKCSTAHSYRSAALSHRSAERSHRSAALLHRSAERSHRSISLTILPYSYTMHQSHLSASVTPLCQARPFASESYNYLPVSLFCLRVASLFSEQAVLIIQS